MLVISYGASRVDLGLVTAFAIVPFEVETEFRLRRALSRRLQAVVLIPSSQNFEFPISINTFLKSSNSWTCSLLV